MKVRRIVTFLRDLAVSATVALGLLVVAEVALRASDSSVRELVNVEETSGALEDNVLGYRYRPNVTVRHRTHEFDVEYCINANAMRDATVERADRGDPRHILVLGDSFTFGAGNKYDDIWPVIMEQRLRESGHNIDVINAGVEGYDTRSEALYLERLFDDVSPDIVLIGFLPNDIFTNRPLDAEPARSSRLHERSRGILPLRTVALAKRIILSSDAAYARVYLMTAREEYFTLPMNEHVARQFALTEDLLAATSAACREKGVLFCVVSIPQQFQVIERSGGFQHGGVNVDFIDERLSARAKADGYPWIELLPILTEHYSAEGAHLFYRIDGHLNALGNRIVGEHAAVEVSRLLSP